MAEAEILTTDTGGDPGAASAPAVDLTNPSFERFRAESGEGLDTSKLAGSYLALEQKLGERPLSIPEGEVTPEEMVAFRRQLPGVPAEREGYVAALTLPDGVPFDDTMVTQVLDGAYARGIADGDVQYFFDTYAALITGQQTAAQEQTDVAVLDAHQTLKDWYGVEKDKNVEIAQAYVSRNYADTSWLNTLMATADGKTVALKNMPEVVDMLYKLGKMTGHDQFVQGRETGGFHDRASATAELAEARAKHTRKEISTAELNAAIEQLQPIATGQQG